MVDLRRVSDSLKFKMETDGPPVSHDDILREKLEELRDLFEEEAENARQELVDAYSSKVCKSLLVDKVVSVIINRIDLETCEKRFF